MWGIVLGLAGVAVVVYELWTRPKSDSPPAVKPGGGMQLAGSPLRQYEPPMPKVGAAAYAKCNLQATDIADADRWSATFLGTTLNLPSRLNAMRSVVAPIQWPESARRTWCAFVQEGLV